MAASLHRRRSSSNRHQICTWYLTGEVIRLVQRLKLLDWAERTQGWIVEDDCMGG
ncbi:hypothetical protein PS918_05169 [Pseudomonas fluorescens]|uniref:Uncharacterized protein n=1 Tax=Pseudomonas fluorescens TaxID=294 RepID=A0A5E7UHA2_PSEFL|nr:hypothetical protein PS918_05169 [Pseudomonas fluorescens]